LAGNVSRRPRRPFLLSFCSESPFRIAIRGIFIHLFLALEGELKTNTPPLPPPPHSLRRSMEFRRS
jgi:hypothetical protein